MRFRPYKDSDAAVILSWLRTEEEFRKWSADRYKDYPAKPEDMNEMYRSMEDTDNYYPFTMADDDGPVGHLMLRYPDEEKKIIRFGFVIVDPEKRGQGYGKMLLKYAEDYAFGFLGAEKLTLGVFENNPPAIRCYEACGFTPFGEESYTLFGEEWRDIEMEKRK